MDFIKSEFDKLLLAMLLLLFCGMAWWAYHAGGQAGLAAFATDQAKTIIGALLGLITGRALALAQVAK
jgi:cbb3-type cytochrome oxidase subunit 3